MCSIIGYYKLDVRSTPEEKFVPRGFELMRHRGPDAENFKSYENGTIVLGHQRLSIIDTGDRSNQPLEDDTSAISFNGEIYNYLEIKKEILNIPKWNTDSDTEVLQKGLEKMGVPFLNHCNGMFAFAFLNKRTKELTLGRDRFGVKPLNYMIQDGILYFSSELGPLIEIKRERKKNASVYRSFIDETATDYDKNTFIEGIFQLEKCHYLSCIDGKYEVKQWYFGKDFIFDRAVFKDKTKTIEFAENLLVDAIEKRMRADVPLCITLSGGLDSTTIYTLIKERLKRRITPFTFAHKGSKTDESWLVEKLTSAYDDDVRYIEPDNKLVVADLLESLDLLEFPNWNPSAVAYMNMYKKISSYGFKVVIEGHGSDEQLGGYPYMVECAFYDAVRRLHLVRAWELFGAFRGTMNKAIEQKINLKHTFKKIIAVLIRRKNTKITFKEAIDRAFNYSILPIVLRTFDRLPMGSSIESRSPFMDYRVIEFFKEVPDDLKVSKLGSKAILREILKKYGKDFIYKKTAKMGFASDIPSMLKDVKLRGFLKKKIDSLDADGYGELKSSALHNIAERDITWTNIEPIWKAASLSIVNEKYKI